jgi:hypothetical protein
LANKELVMEIARRVSRHAVEREKKGGTGETSARAD